MTTRVVLRSGRRRLGTVLAILTLVPTWAGCTKGVRTNVAPESVPLAATQHEKIVGVSTKDGRVIDFDDPGAHLKNDTLYARVSGDYMVLAMDQTDRVFVERREGNTVATIGLVVGVTLGLLVVMGAIAAATKESCPFVYSWDGEKYVFDAEPYGGAITRGLERDDYAPLESLRPVGGQYRLRVTNEVNETQHTNFMELWLVDHQPGARIAADADGNLYAVQGRQPPVSARDAFGRDLLPWLEATDQLIWEPMAVPEDGSLQQDLVLAFPRDREARRARLVVNAATGLWGSHMIREFVQLRGEDGAADWFRRLDADAFALAELHAWNVREQLYVLRIYVEEPTGWELRGTLRGEGPFIAHDRVVELDVSRVTGDEIRVRIEPPRGFWALNSFGIDYAFSPALVPTRVPLQEAWSADGTDVLDLLRAVDDAYYEMPEIGDQADLSFRAPGPVPGKERSVILHSRGYYDLHLDPAAAADEDLVQQVEQEPGAGVVYSAALYENWSEAELMRRLEGQATGGARN